MARDAPAPHFRRLLLLGAALTGVLTVAPLVDAFTLDSIGDHVRTAYPTWSADDIALDRAAITGYLVGTGLLGVLAWLVALRAARRPGRGRIVISAMFALGMTIALSNLAIGGEQYATVVPIGYATAWLAPVAVGAVACRRSWLPGATRPRREVV